MSTGCQNVSQIGRKIYKAPTDRQTDRKTDRLFSLVIKTKVFHNVNRMSNRQSDRLEDIQSAGQTERQNASMTVWQIAGQLKSPLLFQMDGNSS